MPLTEPAPTRRRRHLRVPVLPEEEAQIVAAITGQAVSLFTGIDSGAVK